MGYFTHDNGEERRQLGLEAKERWLAVLLAIKARDRGHAQEAVVVVAEPALLGEQSVVDALERGQRSGRVGQIIDLGLVANFVDGGIDQSRGGGDLVVAARGACGHLGGVVCA